MRMTVAALMVSLLATLGASGVLAQSTAVLPPPEWSDEIPGEGTLKQQPAVGVRMGELFVMFETTTLHSVLNRAGVGAIGERGQTSQHISFVCFTDAVGTPPVRVWLISNVMGNPDQRVMELNAVTLGHGDAAKENCPQLPKKLRPLSLDRGIWIGSSKSRLIEKLGQASGTFDGWLVFNFFGHLPGPYQAPTESVPRTVNWDVTSVLSARLTNDRIAALRAVRVTSY